MRKALIILTLSALLVAFSASSVLAGIVVKIGPDVSGKVEASFIFSGVTLIAAEEDVEMGITLGGEYISDSSSNLVYGAGFEYQLIRKVKDAANGFNFIPIYALGRYQFAPYYLTVKAGYNLFQVEDPSPDVVYKGGLFYGIGGGVTFDALQVELLYSINNGEILPKDSSIDEKVGWKYSKINLSVGYKF